MAYFRRRTEVINDTAMPLAWPDMFIGQTKTKTIGGSNDINRGLFEASIAENHSFGEGHVILCTLHSKIQNFETYNYKKVNYLNFYSNYQKFDD